MHKECMFMFMHVHIYTYRCVNIFHMQIQTHQLSCVTVCTVTTHSLQSGSMSLRTLHWYAQVSILIYEHECTYVTWAHDLIRICEDLLICFAYDAHIWQILQTSLNFACDPGSAKRGPRPPMQGLGKGSGRHLLRGEGEARKEIPARKETQTEGADTGPILGPSGE